MLPGAVGDPKTMAWWATQPAAWEATRRGARDPAVVMPEYVAWLKGLPGKPVFVGYPVAYDFMFVYWYLIRFVGESPFSHSALDVKTLAMAALGKPYRDSTKRNMPREWFGEEPHTHVALDDAIGQGVLFCNVLAAVRRAGGTNRQGARTPRRGRENLKGDFSPSCFYFFFSSWRSSRLGGSSLFVLHSTPKGTGDGCSTRQRLCGFPGGSSRWCG